MNTLNIAIAQLNLTVGDITGNTKKIIANITKAHKRGAHIIVFPELAITGYPPEDLILHPSFIKDNLASLKKIKVAAKNIVAVVGFIDKDKDGLYNAAAVIKDKKIKAIYHKRNLPNYGVFDEHRYFKPGKKLLNFTLNNHIFSICICEDIWVKDGPQKFTAKAGASLLLNLNASPFYKGKIKERERIVKESAIDNNLSIVYTNMVGGQDELVFDGQSFAVDNQGKTISHLGGFKEDLQIIQVAPKRKKQIKNKNIELINLGTLNVNKKIENKISKKLSDKEEVLQALILGTKDYVKKNNFKHCLIGLSGGIDSALVAALAVKALGKENVSCIYMPTKYSSKNSERDARKLAHNIGCKYDEMNIQNVFDTHLKDLKPFFKNTKRGVAEENLQARIRGNTLMSISNKFGYLVLTTGNKSEMSVGYSTLYGDMAGGFAVIKDTPKTLVFDLCEYINEQEGRELIPKNIITKPPSAELRPNQKDEDSLPPYEVLDPILSAYIEKRMEIDDIVGLGYKRKLVKEIIAMVDRNEYKRRQAPPGVKITETGLGKDRRMPITSKYRQT